MKKSQVPYYNDPTDFENGDNTYPCDTQFMEYNVLLHQYFLTREALNYYGSDVERKYISDNPNKVEEFINKVSDKIYSTIQWAAGWDNFQVMLWRIATAPKTKRIQSQYAFRKEFEKILVEEARWLLNCSDSAEYSDYNMEVGNRDEKKPEERERDLSDISKNALRKLEYLGLLRWFKLSQFTVLNDDKY